MKKMLIGALVGAIIIFIWQFLSWGALNLHGGQMQYTAKQDTIMSLLGQTLEEGSYYLPTVAKGTSQEETKKFMEEAVGKPWATIQYHDSYDANMAVNMIRGFVTDFVAVFLLCWLLMNFTAIDFRKSLLASLAVGFIGWLTINYINSIWFEGDTWMDLLDVIINWGLVGAWLGWWLKK